MLDTMGRPLTQSLFLELGYSDSAIYTLKENDHVYEGRSYPSLKKLYLLVADPTEYTFATTFLLGWKHWQRIVDNKSLKPHVGEWREELEVKLRSQGVKEAIKQAQGGTFQAAKWLADRGWEKRGAGRPTEAEIEGHKKFEKKVEDEYGADIKLMSSYK